MAKSKSTTLKAKRRRRRGLHPDTDRFMRKLAKIDLPALRIRKGSVPQERWDHTQFNVVAALHVCKLSTRNLAERAAGDEDGAMIELSKGLMDTVEFLKGCADVLNAANNRILVAMSRNVIEGEKADRSQRRA